MRVKAGHFAAKKRNRPTLKLSKCIIKAIANSVECGRSVRKLLTSQLIGVLASYWPCVTDFSGLSTHGLTA